jgi:hypothetical protein
MRAGRTGKHAPPPWAAQFIAAVRYLHPAADLSTQAVDHLRPFIDGAYQAGLGPIAAAQRVCVRGARVSGGTLETPPRPSVRPPRGAKAGVSFGADDLREPATIERWKKQLAKAEKAADKAAHEEQQERYMSAASGSTRAREAADARALKAAVRRDEHLEDVERLRRLLAAGVPKKPSRPRVTRGATCPPRNPACGLGLLGGTCGLPASLVLAAAQGAPIPRSARYCLAPASRLIPSHNPQRGFVPNADYPPDVQERAYDRDKGEQLKVLNAAQNLIPELIFNTAPGVIDGLPVATSDGIVLGGNGRTQALQLHYAQGGSTASDYLAEHAREFGFTKKQIQAIPDPVVVRVIETPKPDARDYRRTLQELVRLLNIPLTKALDAQSESVAEARRLSDEVLDVLALAFQDDTTLAEYLASPASRPLVSALRRSGIVTDRNAVTMLTPDGLLSADGRQQVERILTAALIPDAPLLERIGPQLRVSLARSAPYVLAAAAFGGGWDLRAPLARAARDLAALRLGGARSVDQFLRQTTFGERPRVEGDPIALSLLRLLHSAGNAPLRLSSAFRRFASQARFNPVGQAALFASEAVIPQTALEQLLPNEKEM